MSDVHDLVSKLSPREQFKFAFLEKCAEQGLSSEEMLEKAAMTVRELQDYFTNAAKGIGLGIGTYTAAKNPWITAGLIGLPLAGGALAGRTIAKLQEPSDYDIDAIKRQEILDEYYKQTDRLTREKRVRDYREQDAGKGGRPLL